MFNIHDLRITQNFTAYNTISQRENLDFFLIIDVVKLLQSTLNNREDFFERRIEFNRVKDKKILKYLMKNKGYLLVDFAEDAFTVKPKTYFLLKEIYEIQKSEDEKVKKIREKNQSFFLNKQKDRNIKKKEFI